MNYTHSNIVFFFNLLLGCFSKRLWEKEMNRVGNKLVTLTLKSSKIPGETWNMLFNWKFSLLKIELYI